ncbi:hypothetical protein PR048_023851 [Dryococelus australis]|uniref:Uncharacterized protein n=1 Tax=Dryococelus australis TaxID=614101 RepID=A0ABQ9GVA9_9NEOP|nr:hypothetical protein PR048_023851 [Dryococelus australis]
MKRYWQRLKKKGFGDEMKKKDRERKKNESAELMVLREKERINKRKCRSNIGNIFEENTNDPNSSNATSHYKSCSTLQKAVKRVSTHIPYTPRMCKNVVSELAVAHGLSINTSHGRNKIEHLQPGTEETVTEFYVRDDI